MGGHLRSLKVKCEFRLDLFNKVASGNVWKYLIGGQYRTNPSFAYENLRFNRNKDCDLVRSYFCTYLVPEDLSQVRYNARCVYPKCSIVAEKEKSQSSRILSSFQTSSFLLTLKKWGIVKSFPILGVSRY